ncbi:nucleotidyltransferase domain-containing protein [Paenibacillus ihbetae]|uniref:Renal dipeptidase n=1 Tax=Paenibacillus ihbetae TaxID=1870820 RepID=A0ABX3JR36_9BACL|nr:nucleotidyltransferase family protein [Paenibacillus ihbetae]OOC59297.1 hypothetical protein BBD40_27125 [Paenibacillus ihbetae]
MNNSSKVLDPTSLSKELQLLLLLVVENNESALLDYDYTNLDWGYFLELTRHHRLYPVAYVKLNKLLTDCIPSDVLKELQLEYQKNTFRMLKLSMEMEYVVSILNVHGINALVLKGPVLSESLYGDVSLRTSKDIDILISIDQLDQARQVMVEHGYEFKEDLLSIGREWKWRWHHLSCTHPERGIEIEIHWRLSHDSGNEPTFTELWDRKRRSPLTKRPVYFLGKEDLFFYLVTHGARHGWFRLRWLLDIDRMILKGIDKTKLELLLDQYRSKQLAGQALILSSRLLKTPLTEELEHLTNGRHSYRLAVSAFKFISEIVRLEFSEPSVRYQLSLKTKLQKAKFLVSRLHPDSLDLQMVNLPRRLYFLYYPLRPFLWLARKCKCI